MRHLPRHRGDAAAFAEGRRLREASRRRRAARAHGSGRRRVPRAVSTVLWVLALPFLFTGAAMLVAIALGIAILTKTAVLLPPLLIGALVFVTARRIRQRVALRRGGAPGTAPLPGRPAAPPRPDLVWARARERFHRLGTEYAAYECDAMAVLRLPALADVSVASTGRFVDAFAEAQAWETDALPPAEHAARFVAAVDRAERAWRAARDAAERIRLSGLSPTERGTVERIIKLLTTARDSDNDPERLAAYARARSELAKLDRTGVLHLPRTAMTALGKDLPPALPAA